MSPIHSLTFVATALAGLTLGAAGPPAAQAAPGNAPPPILVTLNAHGHNFSISKDPETDWEGYQQQKQAQYDKHRAEILWLAQTTERLGARMSYQLNGEYVMDAVMAGDEAHLLLLESRGHSLSTHFHRYYYSGADGVWTGYSAAEETPELCGQSYADHIGVIEELLGHPLHRADGACGDREVSDALAELYGTTVETSSEALSWTEWNTFPMTPFRRALGTDMIEDPSVDRVSFGSFGQIGKDYPAGLHAVHTSVPQLQRHFLAVMAERQERYRLGMPPLVFSFAAMTHPDQNAGLHEEVGGLYRWLARWTNRTFPGSGQVAQFTTDAGVREALEAWEDEYSGLSSFTFDYDAYLEDPTSQSWPYLLEGVVTGMRDAELDDEVKTWRPQRVVAFRLDKRYMVRGEPNEDGQEPLCVSEDILGQMYLVWSNAGPKTIDFSSELPGVVFVRDGATGVLTAASAASLAVTGKPMLVVSDPTLFGDYEVDASCPGGAWPVEETGPGGPGGGGPGGGGPGGGFGG